jgi:hypothetical protein
MAALLEGIEQEPCNFRSPNTFVFAKKKYTHEVPCRDGK